MKRYGLAFAMGASVLALAAAAPASAALTLHTSAFITTPTNFNGFEAIGPITGANGVTSHTEDGIAVDYIGSTSGIWSNGHTAPEGQYSWYPDGGGYGYSRITFADTNQIQFQAASGFFSQPTSLSYEVLLNGVLVGTGSGLALQEFGTGFTYYGFSGALFDEVRLQAQQSANAAFNSGAYEALALDAIALGNGAVVPEPATWAMMVLGFGIAGAAMRRRRHRIAFA